MNKNPANKVGFLSIMPCPTHLERATIKAWILQS